MKYPTFKEIRKMYFPVLLLSLILILGGFFTSILFCVNPTPQYDEMQGGIVRVDSVKYVSHYRGGGHYELKTLDGEYYNLSGDLSLNDVRDLPKGAEIKIKWYAKTWLFDEKLYIEEIVYQDEMLSVYTNDDNESMLAGFAIGAIVMALGVGGIFLYRHFMSEEIRKIPPKHRK